MKPKQVLQKIASRFKLLPIMFVGIVLVAACKGATYEDWVSHDLKSGPINAIEFDHAGNVWVGTDTGVFAFDGETWNSFSQESMGLSGNRITALAVDLEGRVWVGALGSVEISECCISYSGGGGGLTVFDGESWTPYSMASSGLVHNNVTSIAIDPNGRIWVGSGSGLGSSSFSAFEGGISVFDGENWQVYTKDNSGLNWDDVRAIAIDPQGKAYIGTTRGFNIFDGQTWESSGNFSSAPLGQISTIDFDQEGRPLFGDYNASTVSILTDGGLETYSKDVLGGVPWQILALAVDGEGRLWLGSTAGATVAHQGAAQTFSEGNSPIMGDSIGALGVDNEGNIWIGAYNGSLYHPPEDPFQ